RNMGRIGSEVVRRKFRELQGFKFGGKDGILFQEYLTFTVGFVLVGRVLRIFFVKFRVLTIHIIMEFKAVVLSTYAMLPVFRFRGAINGECFGPATILVVIHSEARPIFWEFAWFLVP